MPLRAFAAALVLLLALTLAAAPAGVAQSRNGDLSDLWEQYPLDPGPNGARPFGPREIPGSTAGPPPAEAEPAGALPLAVLFFALALGLVGVAGGALQVARGLRRRHRERAGRRLGAGAGNLGG